MASNEEYDSESDPYNTDEDTEYKPEDDLSEHSQQSDNEEQEMHHITPTRTRKRRKNYSKWKRNERKQLRTEGKEYVGNKGVVHASKQLIAYNHLCRYKCNENISEVDRQALFDKFYKLPSYDLQTAYLSSCINKVGVSRRKQVAVNNRKFATEILLMNKRVCKPFFLKTFDITNRRFTTVCAKTDKFGICETDKRGKMPSTNKVDESARNSVISHIKMFPKYKSHYSRKDNSNTRYLSPELNVAKMYTLYKDYCGENKIPVVKLSYYRNIFNTEFNLRFHKPHSDTCSKCDNLNNVIKNSPNETSVQAAKVSSEIHQRKAQKASEMKKLDIESNKESVDTVVICFDLQQTLATPLLTTSKVFYLRQLWTYNFGIHNLVTGEAHMYTWDETVSGRGSQEKSLPSSITKIIAYSDSCGGQNKNKNICKMFMFLVKATNLEEVQHKFLEPGHTYMECDRDFAMIEKCKKKNSQVFIPQHWRDVIAGSCKKFTVHNMTKEQSYSFEKLNSLIQDPKKDTEGKALKFREIAHFRYGKDLEPFSFQCKPVLDDFYQFLQCKCGSRSAGRPSYSVDKTFTQLRTVPVSIKLEKWKNLQTLLDFVPPVYHSFYTDMSHEDSNRKGKKPSLQAGPSTAAVSEDQDPEESDEEIYVEDDNISSDYEA